MVLIDMPVTNRRLSLAPLGPTSLDRDQPQWTEQLTIVDSRVMSWHR
jgi:hypothetical protein